MRLDLSRLIRLVNFDQSSSPLSLNINKRQIPRWTKHPALNSGGDSSAN
jgi:hypothetical protein